MKISLKEAAGRLREMEDVYILSHQYPDGDTLGSASALCRALRAMGKRAQTFCSDKIPHKFDFLFEGLETQSFEPRCIVSVDIADEQLLGEKLSSYAGKIDLCIDHHGSNTGYAADHCVCPDAAATTEMIYDLILLLGVELDTAMATCIYTGISTDTGCFKYTNATPRTYRIAAEMMEKGIDAARINRLMFDTKSRARLEIERRVLDTMDFYLEDACAIIYVTKKMVAESGAGEDDMDGLAAMPRQVEGVSVGITLREKKDGAFKVSVRTTREIDASRVCARFGGGGHPAAAGCVLTGDIASIKARLVQAVAEEMGKRP